MNAIEEVKVHKLMTEQTIIVVKNGEFVNVNSIRCIDDTTCRGHCMLTVTLYINLIEFCMFVTLPPGSVTAFLMNVALLSISPAVHGQLVKLFKIIEPHGKFRSTSCIHIDFNFVQPLVCKTVTRLHGEFKTVKTTNITKSGLTNRNFQ